jgi:thiol-disulfide isomerase/thioredoxin
MKLQSLWPMATLVGALSSSAATLPIQGRMPPLTSAVAWLYSAPLTPLELRGKVVLVDFWTYTCINWRRTAPWLRHWAEKYRNAGLVVIGVHTPEFGFEGDVENVRRAVVAQDINYAVAVDSRHKVWDAFNNQYWPALYFVDAKGRIRHHQFGEGDYDKLEQIIRQLLLEAGHTRLEPLATVRGQGAEAAADWNNLRSAETHTGYARIERFASQGVMRLDMTRDYTAPAELTLNHWALQGGWNIQREFTESTQASASAAYQFHARDVHVVLSPHHAGAPVHFRIMLDGQPPGAAHGGDVDSNGYGVLDEPRMYHLIRQVVPVKPRRMEIEFFDSGARLFAFTFG